MIHTPSSKERRILEQCLARAKRTLNQLRAEGNTLKAALVEADVNRMLDELQERFYRKADRR